MMKRNEPLINLFGLILTILLAVFVYLALTDSGQGLTMMSADLEQRVSYSYLLKNVSKAGRTENQPALIEVIPGREGYENGAINIVTAIVADYRMLDTFGEILVLFAASAGVSLLMVERKREKAKEASEIVKTAVPIIMLFALVTGFYIISHGHLTPGGGFPGGAVIASAFILQFLAFQKSSRNKAFRILESLAGISLLAMGLIGLYLEGSLFANFLPTGPLGATVSATGIMIVYALIGIKVAAELSSISADFIGE